MDKTLYESFPRELALSRRAFFGTGPRIGLALGVTSAIAQTTGLVGSHSPHTSGSGSHSPHTNWISPHPRSMARPRADWGD